ncbi:MAG: hypothetical protein ABH845_04475 [Candidatus Omnitrophota bacterium]
MGLLFLTVLSAFLLAETGWAATSYVPDTTRNVIQPANPEQLIDAEKRNELAASEKSEELAGQAVEIHPTGSIVERTLQDSSGKDTQLIRVETYDNADGSEGSRVTIRDYKYNAAGEQIGYEEAVTTEGWIPNSETGELVYFDNQTKTESVTYEQAAARSTDDDVVRYEQETKFIVGIVANRLVVLGTDTLTKMWDLLTGEYTETKSTIRTRYDRNGNPIQQTGYSESTSESKDGTETTSRTKLVFAYIKGLAGFAVVSQTTDTVAHSPGALNEDRYLTDDDGNLVLDSDGNAILLETAGADDVTSTTRSTITREYEQKSGKLLNVEGSTRGRTTGAGEDTRFTGVMEFDICNNSECLSRQVTESTTRNMFTGERTASTSEYVQEHDWAGRVLSAQANTHSVTTAGTTETLSDSVTSFVVTSRNTVAATGTHTESVSIDRQNMTLTRSTQDVSISVDSVGRVLGASGTLSSQTVRVNDEAYLEGSTVAELSGQVAAALLTMDDADVENDACSTIANTSGAMTFDVINNQIVMTSSYTKTTETDFVQNTETIQEQWVTQNYDAETGLGTTGHITSRAITTSQGQLSLNPLEGGTHYDPVSGQWVIVAQEGDVDGVVYTVSLAEIDTTFRGNQFVAERIASVSVSYDDSSQDRPIQTNVTFTRQVYSSSGQLLGMDIQSSGFGSGIFHYEGRTDPTTGELSQGADESDEVYIQRLLGSLGSLANDILNYYFNGTIPVQEPQSRPW